MSRPLVVLITLTWLLCSVKAQSDCISVLMSLSPCLNYVTGNSSAPSASCCSQLGVVVRSKPECLCSVLNGSADASLGISINKTLALQLPNACNLKTPPASKCDAAGAHNGPSPQSSASAGGSDAARMPILFATIVSFGLVLWSF